MSEALPSGRGVASVARVAKRVAVVLPSHWSAHQGGAELQVKYLVDALVATGSLDVTYVARNIAADFRPTGYDVVRVHPFRPARRLGLLADAPALHRALARLRPDVIYQRVGGIYTGVAARYARRAGCRLVWHVASEMDLQGGLRAGRIAPLQALNRRALAFAARNADTIVVQTEDQRELLHLRYGRTAHLVRNYQPVPADQAKPTEVTRIVWVSNFKRLKRPELFLRLAEDLQDLTHVEFVMIGRLPQDPAWRDELLARMGRIARFRFAGELSHDAVNDELAAGHLLVSTSETEGFPNTFIQAWMRSMPVVSLDVDPDRLLEREPLGRLARSYSELRASVRELVADAECRATLGAQARRFATETFAMRNADQLAALLGRNAGACRSAAAAP